jgi:hypothetical protein
LKDRQVVEPADASRNPLLSKERQVVERLIPCERRVTGAASRLDNLLYICLYLRKKSSYPIAGHISTPARIVSRIAASRVAAHSIDLEQQ